MSSSSNDTIADHHVFLYIPPPEDQSPPNTLSPITPVTENEVPAPPPPRLVIISNNHAQVFVALNHFPGSRLLLLTPYMALSHAPPSAQPVLERAGLNDLKFVFPDADRRRIGFDMYPKALTPQVAEELAGILEKEIYDILEDTVTREQGKLQDPSICAFAQSTIELYHPRNLAEVRNSLSRRPHKGQNHVKSTHFRSLHINSTQPHAKAGTVMRETLLRYVHTSAERESGAGG